LYKLWLEPLPGGNLGHRVITFSELLDGFFFEFKGEMLCAHGHPPMLKS
jgi:hypothetical protein